MQRRKRNKKELVRASEQLYYEFWMLTSLAQGLASGMAVRGWLQNALLESFIIHVRALLEFFYTNDPKSDDIVALDYFSDRELWVTLRPGLSRTLRIAKQRAGKEVAHLTYGHLKMSPENKTWAFMDITAEIRAIVGIFLKNTSAELLAPQWESTQYKQSA